jgi:hypothetical protein
MGSARIPALAGVLLGGCLGYSGAGLRPGIDGAEEVRAAMGAPKTVWAEADGSATWEYPRGPAGRHTYFVRLGPDGHLAGIEQVLEPQRFTHIQVGRSTREEVHRLIGSPWQETYFPRKGELVWSYKYRDVNPRQLHVGFDDRGVVTSVFSLDDLPSPRGFRIRMGIH